MRLKHLLLLTLSSLILACTEGENRTVFEGKLNRSLISQQTGFGEQKEALLLQNEMNNNEFIALTTVRVNNLDETERARLKKLRNSLVTPNAQTLLQKVIPLSTTTDFMDNLYGGTVGGFVCIAPDVKNLHSMFDIYWGLRLDYTNTKFKPDGAGYAVVRFFSSHVDKVIIPYSTEMGGTITDPLPFGGGGFTTSTLGAGGFPEYKFTGYYAPNEGAELYECTPSGTEILRSVFTDGKWVTFEGETVTTKSAPTLSITPRQITYKGHQLYLRGATTEGAHLFSFDPTTATALGMETYSKGEYRLIVPLGEIEAL